MSVKGLKKPCPGHCVADSSLTAKIFAVEDGILHSIRSVNSYIHSPSFKSHYTDYIAAFYCKSTAHSSATNLVQASQQSKMITIRSRSRTADLSHLMKLLDRLDGDSNQKIPVKSEIYPLPPRIMVVVKNGMSPRRVTFQMESFSTVHDDYGRRNKKKKNWVSSEKVVHRTLVFFGITYCHRVYLCS